MANLTFEEKINLLSGETCWDTKEIVGKLPSIMFSDGPHGLRKQIGFTDNLGVGESEPATCFPTASLLACSFDRNLLFEVGKAIGEECREVGVSVILGPGISQKRSPLCGRNFEYFSEDPVVSGELGAAWINGAESTGTGTSLKHFAVNNQEKRRMTINAIVDERALWEVYLKSFEIALQKSKPATVMCSYNRLNGVYNSENDFLLKEVLRDTWGYQGIVVSDWGAVHDRVQGVKAGMNIEMPGNKGLNDRKVSVAVQKKILSPDDVDALIEENVKFIEKYQKNAETDYKYNRADHHALAVKAAEQSAVLLKNSRGLLPLDKKMKTLVVGELAEYPRIQGAGSSKIHPNQVDKPLEIIEKDEWNFSYVKGYEILKTDEKTQEILRRRAVHEAEQYDQVIVFAGLPEGYESEGFDRKDMKLPEEQNALIDELAGTASNLVVVLLGGAPMEIPWEEKVSGILLMYLAGEGMGTALSGILSGEVCPGGKLAETWPEYLENNPSYHYFPGGQKNVEYRESIYVGYRYYETSHVRPRYPFGYGLSYTKFSYENMHIEKNNYCGNETLKVSVTIRNTGTRAGAETVFLFTHACSETVAFPAKELRDFKKVFLTPGESSEVRFLVPVIELKYFNPRLHRYYLHTGEYEVMLGSSVEDIQFKEQIFVSGENGEEVKDREENPEYFFTGNRDGFKGNTGGWNISEEAFQKIYGAEIPSDEVSRPYTPENTLEDIKDTFLGKLLLKYANSIAKGAGKKEEGQEEMLVATIREMPFFAMVYSGEDLLPEYAMWAILDMLNGHPIKGISRLIRKKGE